MRRAVFILVVSQVAPACALNREAVTNGVPEANAGEPQEVQGGDQVTLSGDGTDPDNDAFTFSWEQVGGDLVGLSSTSAPEVTFEAPRRAQTLVFSLTVADELSESLPSLVHVVILFNQPPVADPGGPYEVLSQSSVLLDGSSSSDPDDEPVRSYAWLVEAGPPGSDLSSLITGAESQNPLFVPDERGSYSISLIVEDRETQSTKGYAVVQSLNNPPVAEAGDNQVGDSNVEIVVPGTAEDLENDPIIGWSWALVAPAGASYVLLDEDTSNARFTANAKGTYVLELRASDGDEGPPDQVSIEINNSPPDVSVVASINTDNFQPVELAAQITDTDGDVPVILWRVETFPSGATFELVNDDESNATFTPNGKGDYVLSLFVSDGQADVTELVTVHALNAPPVANAGPDFPAAPGGGEIFLDTSLSSDPDGDPITFTWSHVSGAVPAQLPTGPNPTFITPSAIDTTVLSLVVSDGEGSSVPDLVIITMTDLAPTANAGGDQTPDGKAVVTLNGTSPDGAVTSFRWTQTAGPPVTLSDAFAATTSFTAPGYDPFDPQRFTFELQAQDPITLAWGPPDPAQVRLRPQDGDFFFGDISTGSGNGVGNAKAAPIFRHRDLAGLINDAVGFGYRQMLIRHNSGIEQFIDLPSNLNIHAGYDANWDLTGYNDIQPAAANGSSSCAVFSGVGTFNSALTGFIVRYHRNNADPFPAQVCAPGNVDWADGAAGTHACAANDPGCFNFGVHLANAGSFRMKRMVFAPMASAACTGDHCNQVGVWYDGNAGALTVEESSIFSSYSAATSVEPKRAVGIVAAGATNGLRIDNNLFHLRSRAGADRYQAVVVGPGNSGVTVQNNDIIMEGTPGAGPITGVFVAGATAACGYWGSFFSQPVDSASIDIRGNYFRSELTNSVGIEVNRGSLLRISHNTLSGYPIPTGDKYGIRLDPAGCAACVTCIQTTTIRANLIKTMLVGIEERESLEQPALNPFVLDNAITDLHSGGCLYKEPTDVCVTDLGTLNGGTSDDPGNTGNFTDRCIDPATDLISGGADLTLVPGSVCVDAVTCEDAPAESREGTARPSVVNGQCDVGAFEYDP